MTGALAQTPRSREDYYCLLHKKEQKVPHEPLGRRTQVMVAADLDEALQELIESGCVCDPEAVEKARQQAQEAPAYRNPLREYYAKLAGIMYDEPATAARRQYRSEALEALRGSSQAGGRKPISTSRQHQQTATDRRRTIQSFVRETVSELDESPLSPPGAPLPLKDLKQQAQHVDQALGQVLTGARIKISSERRTASIGGASSVFHSSGGGAGSVYYSAGGAPPSYSVGGAPPSPAYEPRLMSQLQTPVGLQAASPSVTPSWCNSPHSQCTSQYSPASISASALHPTTAAPFHLGSIAPVASPHLGSVASTAPCPSYSPTLTAQTVRAAPSPTYLTPSAGQTLSARSPSILHTVSAGGSVLEHTISAQPVTGLPGSPQTVTVNLTVLPANANPSISIAGPGVPAVQHTNAGSLQGAPHGCSLSTEGVDQLASKIEQARQRMATYSSTAAC